MAKILVPLATGFEEIEAVTIIDVCTRAGIKVIVAGVDHEKTVVGANGISINVKYFIEEISNVDDIDMIVLPGGYSGTEKLATNPYVQSLLKKQAHKNKYIGAICAAPIALNKAGVLKENYTCYPSVEEVIRTQGHLKDDIVLDENILTSKGPATAMKFALEIVKLVAGEQVYQGVKEGLLA